MTDVTYRAPRPRQRYIVRGPDGIDEVFARLKHGILATDTETSGLDWWEDRVGALCFAAGDTAAFFCKDALGPAARWLSDQIKARRKFVFHHAKFDMHMIRSTFGIHFPYPVHDTLLMSHLIDNRGAPITKFPWFVGHNLKALATAFVDEHAQEPEESLIRLIQEIAGRRAGKGDWLIAPLSASGKYGGFDPWYTLMLYDQFIDRIRYWPQPEGYPSLMSLYQTERWLTLALRDMEERGIRADPDFLETWARKVGKDRDASQERLNELVSQHYGVATRFFEAEQFNWNSPMQVSALLFDVLGIKPISGRSTDKRSLLRMNHPLASELIKHRAAVKQYTAFAQTLLSKIKRDGAIHTHFNQNVGTGRMSASDPNLQQQARDSGVRAAFIPRKGLVLRSADYSQIEMRFAAHFADEEVLVRGFNDDPEFDTHAALAQRMFGLRNRKPSPQQRDRGKTMNFAMIYGAGEDAVAEQLIDKVSFKEARQSCIELGYRPRRSESPFHVLAQLLRNAVRASYPRMWRFTKDEEKITARRGFVVDAFGYHRYLDEDECYKAMNSKVQGSAAHQAKQGLVNVYRELQLGTGEVAILLQVHDDIIYESAGDPRTDKRVLELLEERDKFKVPMVADLKGSDKNWQDKVKITLKKKKAA